MRFLFAAAVMSVALQAQAITNVEEKRAVEDKPGWHNRAEVGFDAESGNKEKRLWNVGLNTSWQNDQDRVFAWANRVYGSTNGIRTDDNTFFHGRFVHNHKQTWSQESFIQFERDPFAYLMRRALIGGNIRHQNLFGDDNRIYVGAGLFHERVEERDINNDEFKSQLTRANLYTHLQWGMGYGMLQTTLYIQPSVDDTSDTRALWQFAYSLPVSKIVDLKWQWQSRWDTEPPEGAEYHNHQTHLKLVVRF